MKSLTASTIDDIGMTDKARSPRDSPPSTSIGLPPRVMAWIGSLIAVDAPTRMPCNILLFVNSSLKIDDDDDDDIEEDEVLDVDDSIVVVDDAILPSY